MPTSPTNSPGPFRAFTLVELLLLVAVLGILGSIAGVSLSYGRSGSERARCAFHQRQLMQAWQMYADDNSGVLMANSPFPDLNWIKGRLDFYAGNTDNTNTAYLIDPQHALMGQYVKQASLFRCPADPSFVLRAGIPTLRVRSYAMNSYVGTGARADSPYSQTMSNLSQVCQPERTFVLVEEHPVGIDDGLFFVDLAHNLGAMQFLDLPAAFHSLGANLGMADGHVEYWQWKDFRTTPTLNVFSPQSSPNNPDLVRLREATSYPR